MRRNGRDAATTSELANFELSPLRRSDAHAHLLRERDVCGEERQQERRALREEMLKIAEELAIGVTGDESRPGT